jgi:hypothetical protein
VTFEVELAHPHRRIPVFGLGPLEERGRALDPHPGRAVQVGDAVGLGEHLSGRAAATIAVTKRQQGSARPALVGERAGRSSEINRG